MYDSEHHRVLNTVPSVALAEWQAAADDPARRERPVRIAGGIIGSVAVQTWSHSFLAQALGDLEVGVRRRKPEGAVSKGQTVERMPFRDFAGCLHRHGVFFAPQIPFGHFPQLAPQLGLEQLAQPPAVFRLDLLNLWVGDTMRVALHYDGADVALLQVRGSTDIVVEPPTSPASLYVASYKPFMSRVDPYDIRHAAFPRYTADHQLRTVLEQGDVLHVPHGWWYDARAVGPAVWATAWYGPTTTPPRPDGE